MAAVATTPSATAIGTLSSASASMPTSMTPMVIAGLRPSCFCRSCSPSSSASLISMIDEAGGARVMQNFRQPQCLGDDEQHGADRDRRLRELRRHLRQADHVLALQDHQHLDAVEREQDEKQNDHRFGEQRRGKRAAFGGMALTRPGTPIWAPRSAASAEP